MGLIGDIEANIRLIELQNQAARRAEQLRYLQEARRAKRCRQVKSNGKSWGSPALRHEDYCYLHVQMRVGSVEMR